jgi:hypothetical protein
LSQNAWLSSSRQRWPPDFADFSFFVSRDECFSTADGFHSLGISPLYAAFLLHDMLADAFAFSWLSQAACRYFQVEFSVRLAITLRYWMRHYIFDI